MEKELTELLESVKRAAEAADNSPGEEDRCLDALKQLKKFPVNYHILLSTQVGKVVRQLTKHKSSKIKASASDIIGTWKGNILYETMRIPKNEESFENDDPVKTEPTFTEETKAVSIQQIVSSEIERKIKAKSAIMPNYDNSLTPKSTQPKKEYPNSLYCNDSARDKAREILMDALTKVKEESEVKVNGRDPAQVAASVETALFEKWGKSTGSRNRAKYRSVFFNIKDPKNPDFRRRVLAGDVEARDVPNLTALEMASEAMQAEMKELEQKSLYNSERCCTTQQARTDEFTCGRCGKNETTYYQVKMRSREEHMTTYVTCVNCDKMWKF